MDWIRERPNHPIAENPRETIRRFVLHQFIDAGFCLYNDDDPSRATNSSLNNHRISPETLLVIGRYGLPDSMTGIEEYLADAPGLAMRHRAAREMTRVPVTLPTGTVLALSAGGQNSERISPRTRMGDRGLDRQRPHTHDPPQWIKIPRTP